MNKRIVQRQIRYNKKTDTGEQETYRHRWVFLIVNEPREIGRIKEKLFGQMAPVVDYATIDSGIVRNSGSLHYELFSFSTDKGRIERPGEIYDVNSVQFRKDRDLTAEMTSGLSLLING